MFARHMGMVALAVATMSLIAPGAVRADAKAEAEKHFKAGVKLLMVEDWVAAATEFEVSVQLFPTKMGLFNLANAYKALHRYQDALETVDRILGEFGNKVDSGFADELDDFRFELLSMVGRLRVRVDVTGAQVTVDGISVGSSPFGPIALAPGEHRVVVSLEGRVSQQRVVQIELGTTETVDFSFGIDGQAATGAQVLAQPTPPLPSPQVNVEDRPAPDRPSPSDNVAEEAPQPRLTQPTTIHPTNPERAVAKPYHLDGEISEVEAAGTEKGNPYAFFWVAFSGTLAAGALTIVFGAVMTNRNEVFDYYKENNYASTPMGEEARDEAIKYTNLTIGFGVTTGVLGAAALTGLIVGNQRATKAKSARRPMAVVAGNGFALRF